MPLVQITIIEGRDSEKRRRLMKKVAEAVSESLDAPAAAVRVIVQEVPAFHWSVAGEPKGDPPQ